MPWFCSPSGTLHGQGDVGSNNSAMDIEDHIASTEPQVQLPPTPTVHGGGSNDPALTSDSVAGDNGSNNPPFTTASATVGILTVEPNTPALLCFKTKYTQSQGGYLYIGLVYVVHDYSYYTMYSG
ncbi:hypothetical protein BDQ17DRAFT_1326008 [Cyathus striatus]|nr:hypothetical protein BDQ17DRAFT_1326008 [Cyathus striatus]